jgi:ABC-type transport system involved in multi-copper enzyme maturation permease subunit
MAIHDQNYVRYEGTLREGTQLWTIAWTTFTTIWSLKRVKLTVLLAYVPVLITLVLIFIEFSVYNSSLGTLAGPAKPGPGGVIWLLQLQLFSLGVLFAAGGCGVIADDLRYRAFQLYFSKPLHRFDYGAGKLLGLFLFGSLVTVIPSLIMGSMRLAMMGRGELLNILIEHTAKGVLLSAWMTAVLSCVVAGLSSLVNRAGYVTLAWIGTLVMPMLLMFIMMIVFDGHQATRLVSLQGMFLLTSESLLVPEALEKVPRVVPSLVTLVIGALGASAVTWRISKLEGVA